MKPAHVLCAFPLIVNIGYDLTHHEDWKEYKNVIISKGDLQNCIQIPEVDKTKEYQKKSLSEMKTKTPDLEALNVTSVGNGEYSLTLPKSNVEVTFCALTGREEKNLLALSENRKKKKLPEGNYKVVINSKHTKGNLELMHAILKGKIKYPFGVSCYLRKKIEKFKKEKTNRNYC